MTELDMAATATSTSTKRSRDGFPFFELPRELRDVIYLCTDKFKVSTCFQIRTGALYAALAGLPDLNLALVGRQFKQEYMENMVRQSSRQWLRVAITPREEGKQVSDMLRKNGREYTAACFQSLQAYLNSITRLDLYVTPQDDGSFTRVSTSAQAKNLIQSLPSLKRIFVTFEIGTNLQPVYWMNQNKGNVLLHATHDLRHLIASVASISVDGSKLTTSMSAFHLPGFASRPAAYRDMTSQVYGRFRSAMISHYRNTIIAGTILRPGSPVTVEANFPSWSPGIFGEIEAEVLEELARLEDDSVEAYHAMLRRLATPD